MRGKVSSGVDPGKRSALSGAGEIFHSLLSLLLEDEGSAEDEEDDEGSSEDVDDSLSPEDEELPKLSLTSDAEDSLLSLLLLSLLAEELGWGGCGCAFPW